MAQYITAAELEKLLKAMAALDIIMISKEDAWLRPVSVHEFDSGYGYVIENGSGDTLTVIFTKKGAFIKGFDHENELNQFAADEWDNGFFDYTYTGVPEEFINMLDEESKDETTFCMWCMDGSDKWLQNEQENNDGGKEYLLGYIRRNAKEWCEWAEAYYEKAVENEIVQKVFLWEQPSEEDLLKLNPECNLMEVLAELAELDGMKCR